MTNPSPDELPRPRRLWQKVRWLKPGLTLAAMALAMLSVVLLISSLAGCTAITSKIELPAFGGPGGKAQIQSASPNGTHLTAQFDYATYTHNEDNSVTMLLVEGEPENPRQALTIQMFYLPIAGYTPVDSNAVNALFEYVVFAPTGEGADAADSSPVKVGVYSGAGFVHPKQTPGAEQMAVSAWDASLVLTDASEGFNDLLGLAKIEGKFVFTLDPGSTFDGKRQLSQRVSRALGYPRSVDAGEARPRVMPMSKLAFSD